VYDGPSTALTPQLLGELYGADVDQLFDLMQANPAIRSPVPGTRLPFAAA